jgi:glycerol-3-phosphate O-acyltransferase
MYPRARAPTELARLVLEAPEVLAAMEAEAAHLAKTLPKKKQRVPPAEMVAARAQGIIKNMFGEPSDNVVSAMGWFFRKVWRRVYEGVFVARQYVSEVTDAAKTGPVIYLPTHRSYIDFLLVSYVAFLLQLPIPFIAAGEDFLGILAVRWLFRKSGAFFMRRSFAQDKLYSAIMQKYVELLLADGQSLEFYIEGTRSRSGKFLQPKLGYVHYPIVYLAPINACDCQVIQT